MITTLTGENDVLRQATLHQMIEAFTSEHSDMALERFDGEEVEYEAMHGSVQSVPFLASRKLVVLRRPSANKLFQENFEKFLGDIAETNDVVLVEPKLDKRLAYYKLLKKHTDVHDFLVLDGNALTQFLVTYAKEKGGILSSNDARLLIDRVGTNQLTLQNELDKLLAYDKKVTSQHIELLTDRTPQSTIFELLDAAFAGNAKRSLEIYYEQRALKIEPQQIIAMLIWQLYILALIKTAKDRSVDTIASQSRLNPFSVRKSHSLARRISLIQLKKLIRSLREFDVRLKSESINADEVVQYYLLSLAQ